MYFEKTASFCKTKERINKNRLEFLFSIIVSTLYELSNNKLSIFSCHKYVYNVTDVAEKKERIKS